MVSQSHSLNSLLSPAKLAPSTVTRAQLSNVSSKDRRDKRKQLLQENKAANLVKNAQAQKLRKYLVIGVNAVTRALENASVCCVLLAANVDPRIMVSHVPTLCAVQAVPLVMTSSLRVVTRKTLGFSCIVIGLKKQVSELEQNHFYPLLERVQDLSSKFSRQEPLAESVEPNIDSSDSSIDTETEEESKPVLYGSLYKYRSSLKERVFVPSGSSSTANMLVSDKAFIQIEDRSKSEERITNFLCFDISDDNKLEQINKSQKNDIQTNKNPSKNIEILGLEFDKTPDEHLKQPLKLKNRVSSGKHMAHLKKNQWMDPDNLNSSGKRRKTLYLPLKVKRVCANPNKIKKKVK
uniref:Ribosomal protein eL8/eL30/eS12/Gadd45 domain-containing protein n=1 Tax=Timema douglasi TaxID=61478 RepID=A0A7R8VGU2_TIMDO|nr:unnamed protein product [Timema douglasi]